MDRLVAERVVKEKEVVVEEKQTQPKQEKKTEQEISVNVAPPTNAYLSSFENVTVADIKKQQEEKDLEEFKEKKEELIQEQFVQEEIKTEEKTQESENIIEKPNYDFIEEKKVIKLGKKEKSKKKNKKKLAAIIMACSLGASVTICITNLVLIENLQSQFVQLDETYNFNLQKYLKNINNLDQTKKSMEIIETYPEELLDAGDVGQSSNWFDRICNFIGGIFGG